MFCLKLWQQPASCGNLNLDWFLDVQLQDKDAISGSADDLLIPLAPEGMKNKEGIEVASASVAPGDYYAPNGTSFVRIAVPLMTTEAPRST